MQWKRIVIMGLQRFWRISRGLTLSVATVIIDAEGRFILAPANDKGQCDFYSAPVRVGESAYDAAAKLLREQAGLLPTSQPTLFAIYSNAAQLPNNHIALFLVSNWQPDPQASPRSRPHAFSLDQLPSTASPAVLRRVAEIMGQAAQQTAW